MQVKFGLTNYWRMYKARGPKLPLYYFLQAHLFDLIHGTDTHRWSPINYEAEKNTNGQHAFMYMASWTGEVKKTFSTLLKILEQDFKDHVFIDVGCGKGKVAMQWHGLCVKRKISQKIYGFDIFGYLIKIARKNHNKLYGDTGNYLCRDILEIDPEEFGSKKFILYLYNPFDDEILNKLIIKFRKYEVFLIYNNPVYEHILQKSGYVKVFESMGFHPNLHTIGFRQMPALSPFEASSNS